MTGWTTPDRPGPEGSGPVVLEVRDLHVRVGGKEILRGLDLTVRAGELHAVMGPNGSGKSTLAHVLAGRDGYERTAGSVRYLGEDLLGMPPEERARRGLFLAFQVPVEIPGVSNTQLIRHAINAVRRHRGLDELDAVDFLSHLREQAAMLQIPDPMLSRPVNEAFSGGEKKRNEILQMCLLEPRLAILDEVDSGLDIDALGTVARAIESLRTYDRAVVAITHYRRLLDHLTPDVLHVVLGGRIVASGGRALLEDLERRGYGWLDDGPPPEDVTAASSATRSEAS